MAISVPNHRATKAFIGKAEYKNTTKAKLDAKSKQRTWPSSKAKYRADCEVTFLDSLLKSVRGRILQHLFVLPSSVTKLANEETETEGANDMVVRLPVGVLEIVFGASM